MLEMQHIACRLSANETTIIVMTLMIAALLSTHILPLLAIGLPAASQSVNHVLFNIYYVLCRPTVKDQIKMFFTEASPNFKDHKIKYPDANFVQ